MSDQLSGAVLFGTTRPWHEMTRAEDVFNDPDSFNLNDFGGGDFFGHDCCETSLESFSDTPCGHTFNLTESSILTGEPRSQFRSQTAALCDVGDHCSNGHNTSDGAHDTSLETEFQVSDLQLASKTAFPRDPWLQSSPPLEPNVGASLDLTHVSHSSTWPLLLPHQSVVSPVQNLPETMPSGASNHFCDAPWSSANFNACGPDMSGFDPSGFDTSSFDTSGFNTLGFNWDSSTLSSSTPSEYGSGSLDSSGPDPSNSTPNGFCWQLSDSHLAVSGASALRPSWFDGPVPMPFLQGVDLGSQHELASEAHKRQIMAPGYSTLTNDSWVPSSEVARPPTMPTASTATITTSVLSSEGSSAQRPAAATASKSLVRKGARANVEEGSRETKPSKKRKADSVMAGVSGYSEFRVKVAKPAAERNSRYGKKLTAQEKEARDYGACILCRSRRREVSDIHFHGKGDKQLMNDSVSARSLEVLANAA